MLLSRRLLSIPAARSLKLHLASSYTSIRISRPSSVVGARVRCHAAYAALPEFPGVAIQSPNNDYVKHLAKLRLKQKYRLEKAAAVLPGVIPILELKKEVPDLNIMTLLWEGDKSEIPEELQDLRLMPVTDRVLKAVSGLETVEGLRAIAEIALPEGEQLSKIPVGELQRLLVLDRVQDPGNVGTLIRTATALGWQGVFFTKGCCDALNDKALRASRGAIFKLPWMAGDWEELYLIMKKHSLTCFAAEPQSEDGLPNASRPSTSGEQQKQHTEKRFSNLALVLGSEGQGLSDKALNLSRLIRIPMSGAMESLSVSQAGAILLFLLGLESPFSASQIEGMLDAEDGLEW